MSSRNPVRLTVALLTYNRLHYLREAVEGILNQTFRDFEFLILDNHSTDGTAQFILGIEDPRIRYVRNAPASSIEFNSVSGYFIARGERVIVTHDDDVMEPDMLEVQMALMDAEPEVKLVWSNVTRIDCDGERIDPTERFSGAARIFPPGAFIEAFLSERLWPMPSAMMLERRQVATRLANRCYFQTSQRRWKASNLQLGGIDDVAVPARTNVRNSIAFLDRPLLRYRVHGNQGTNAVDLSSPSIYLYMTLRSCARRSSRPLDEGLIASHLAKHRLQKRLSTLATPGVTVSTRRLIRRAILESSGPDRRSELARTIAAPLHLAARLTRVDVRGAMERLPSKCPPVLPRSSEAFLAWARKSDRNESILASLPPEIPVILFGSALVSALLILDATRHQRRIVACIDSNIHRQQQKLLGIDILRPEWLRDGLETGAVVVLTSEKDQETHLTRLVRDCAGDKIDVVSWKDLAVAATPLARPHRPEASFAHE